MMRSLLRDESDAILTPIPQYPLYSAAIALYGGHLLPYYLDETHEWGMNVEAMEQQVKQARPRAVPARHFGASSGWLMPLLGDNGTIWSLSLPQYLLSNM